MVDDTLLGQELDEYRLDALLGQGGMARVYRAEDVRLHRDAAIKVIDTPFRANQDHIARFEREAQAIARLNHPNIVKIYRYGEANGFFYIAMELIEGTDLSSVLASHQKEQTFIPSTDVRRIVRQICEALDYLHSQGIIHRDVKPANIVLDKDGNAILTDFGLALLTEIGTQGYIFGTAEYMAPEQVISSTQATPQSDLYAVGVILYQMFTNRLPFVADHPHDVARMHVEESPPSPKTFNPDLTPALEAVILKALSKKPKARYSSCEALAEALNQALKIVETPQPNIVQQRRQPMSSQPSVFVSYSHEDEDEKEALLTHLRVLAKDGLIDVWSDDQIGVGVTWQREMEEAITRAQVAILLISAHYLASDSIVDEQIPKLLKLRQSKDLTVFPIIAKACAWKSIKWLKQVDIRPKHGRPIWREDGHYAQEELAAIVGEVEKIVRKKARGIRTDESVGTFLGKYQLVALIGQGSMGKVYETFHPGLNRRMALKVMDSHRMSDRALERFQDEAVAVAEMRHNHIVRVHDFDQDKGKHYMVMELIEGPTLEAKLKADEQRNRPFPFDQTVNIISALADALDYAHAKGIVHHDLKPANIMFTTPEPDGHLLLTDFGIARIRETASNTIAGMFLGTPYYASPEQAQGQRGDRRSDIYSLGIILYELATGRLPFEADTSEGVMRQHMSAPVPAPTQINPELSEAVAQVILKSLHKNPDERYQTAGELVHALQQAVGEVEPILGFGKPDEESDQLKPGGAAMLILSESSYQPRNLSKAVDRFNRGYTAYQQALNAVNRKDMGGYEKSLLAATPSIVGALELTLKIYLREACSGTKDFAKLKQSNFHTMLTLMEKHARPPLLPETTRQLHDARDIRNAAEHDAVIPAKEELDQAIRAIRQVMLTYLPVELNKPEEDPAVVEERTGTPDYSETITPIQPISDEERASLERQLVNHQDNLRRIEERITEYVDPTEVPLTLLKNRDRVQQQIEKLNARLRPNADL